MHFYRKIIYKSDFYRQTVTIENKSYSHKIPRIFMARQKLYFIGIKRMLTRSTFKIF